MAFFGALFLFLATFVWDRRLRLLHQYTSVWASHHLVRVMPWPVTVRALDPIDPAESVTTTVLCAIGHTG
ncbi:Hypothetical protein A7982_06549 [Minicystis rosea]|nr:Hypothetical protein A7982_06549 [Minicystis rosea]